MQTVKLAISEELVLVVLAGLEWGNGLIIANTLEKQSGARFSLGFVLAALKKLEQKQLVRSCYGDTTPRRKSNRLRLYCSCEHLSVVLVRIDKLWYTEWNQYMMQLIEKTNTNHEKE